MLFRINGSWARSPNRTSCKTQREALVVVNNFDGGNPGCNKAHPVVLKTLYFNAESPIVGDNKREIANLRCIDARIKQLR